MGPPQLDHDLSHSTLEVLSRGLQGASSRARAWIFTGGASHGAAELVGEAMRDSDSPCIGIMSWSRLAERNRLAAVHDGQARALDARLRDAT
jgi:hypothetical protein